MYTRQSQDIHILTTHQSNIKHHPDSLSRDFHRSDQTLTIVFNQILPQYTAVSFHIKQLPSNVISWISSLAAASTLPTTFPKPLPPISMATVIGGAHYSNTQGPQKIFRMESRKRRRQSWCHHSPPQCNETSSEKQGNIYSSTELSIPPYPMYLRPSRHTLGATQP